MKKRRFVVLSTVPALLLFAASCGGNPPPPPQPVAAATAPMLGAPPVASTQPAPTLADAEHFLDRIEIDLRRLWVARDQAGWVNQNFITDDTEALSANGEEATAEYVTRAIGEAKRFASLAMAPEMARKFTLLKLAQVIPAPPSDAERKELAGIESWMGSAYGKGKYCPPRLKGKCLVIDDAMKTLATSRKYDELLEAWLGWHSVGAPMKDKFARYVTLANEGSRQIGFTDTGALWRAGYDMSPADFEADIERLWNEVKPLYDELHCYVRGKLQAKYGKDKVPAHGLIPAHLLGNLWAQEWNNVYDVVAPYPGEASLDLAPKLKQRDAKKMVKTGEGFFTSLGFDALPPSFWERSLFERPKDRDVVCHASAWDVTWSDDLRIKMCIKPTEEDLITIHHELGHDFYFSEYYKLPILFQQGANDGFHEGIGDTIALSVTPTYLKKIGLLDAVPNSPHAVINQQMKMALDKVAFLPFGLLIDKWRWDVFAGKTPKDHYNQAWWDLTAKYQGVAPPATRTEADFDPGSKYHVPASTPYIRYFLARIYQFQFHRALCKVAGHTGPLDQCSIYANDAAGKKLRDMLAMGASRPWQDAMEAISGQRSADASALLEYFAPLRTWLTEANKGQTCGW